MQPQRDPAMRLLLAAAALTFLLIGPTEACTASYVKQLGAANNGHPRFQKASEAADSYLAEQGIDPESPVADTIRPFVVGTSLNDHDLYYRFEEMNRQIEERDGRNLGTILYGHSLDQSIDRIVDESLRCDHHRRHFGDAIEEVGDEIPRPAEDGEKTDDGLIVRGG